MFNLGWSLPLFFPHFYCWLSGCASSCRCSQGWYWAQRTAFRHGDSAGFLQLFQSLLSCLPVSSLCPATSEFDGWAARGLKSPSATSCVLMLGPWLL